MDSTADLSPPLWPNKSFLFNMTTDDTSSNYTTSVTGVMEKAVNILAVCTLFIIMVIMGCSMEVSKIKHHMMKPKGVGIALLSQYCVMPLTAFVLTKMFKLNEIQAVVVLICGCAPGGNLSNILTRLLQGDMNLSIVMTACSTLLGLGMMPLMLYIYCQGFPNLVKVIPYLRIVGSLVMIIIASSIGILINHYRPRHAKIVEKVGFAVVFVAIVTFVIYISYVVKGSVLSVLSAPLLAICGLLPFIGYTFGYIISALFKLNQKERRTVAMETGCQNIPLCTTILQTGFPREAIGALVLFPLVFICLQLMEGLLFLVLFRCHQCFKHKKKGTFQPANTTEQPEVAMTEGPPKDAA